MTRVVEDDGVVEYLSSSPKGGGATDVRKHDGELELLESCPDDPDDDLLVTVAIALRGMAFG